MIRRTRTNPDGHKMEKVNLSIPLDTKFKIKNIADQRHTSEASVYRAAIQDYVSRFKFEGQDSV